MKDFKKAAIFSNANANYLVSAPLPSEAKYNFGFGKRTSCVLGRSGPGNANGQGKRVKSARIFAGAIFECRSLLSN